MTTDDLRQLVQKLREGAISDDQAIRSLKDLSGVAEVGGFAHVDLHRKSRCGFPEVVFGQGKTPEQVRAILQTLADHGQSALATRICPETASLLKASFPDGILNTVARTFQVRGTDDPGPKAGKVVVVTAGTSDLPVAEEARVTAEAWNCEVSLVADVGVAGLHRLLRKLDALEGADVLIVVAGMEGALPSVVGGLASCPVIAVPTSIGYGASFGGLAAMLGMLNSCSSNVVVVNIDGGFNAGHVAGLIARRAAGALNAR